jgi:D-inositol-3-phosphate glycosyltransferase
MRHIVFLSPHSDPEAKIGEVDAGGQCVYEYELAKVLSLNFDTKVTIYTRKKNGYPRLSEVNDRFVIKRIICGGSDDFIPKERLDPHIDEFAQKVAHDLKTENVDVIHAHYWDGGKAAILLHKYLFKEIPIIWTPHSLGGVKRKNFKGMDDEIEYNFVPRVAWESYSMLSSNVIVVSTEDEKQKIVSEYGVEEEKIKVIPPGIPASNFRKASKAESRKRLGLPGDKGVVMSLGRLDRRKGYHHCIHLFSEFDRLFNFDAVLTLFAGKSNRRTEEEEIYFNELKELTGELGLEDKVLFKDAVDYDKVRYIYAASDVYLCLSEYEPFGISILESMYMETPVIATNNGGPRNILTHNVNGILLRPGDYVGGAYNLYALLRDQRYRDQIITNGRTVVKQKYTWLSRAREFSKLYAEVSTTKFTEKQKRFISHVNSIPSIR